MIHHVIGLGPTSEDTIQHISNNSETWGVNDVWKLFPANNVVVVDPPNRFNQARRTTIARCKPISFYALDDQWSPYRNQIHRIKYSRRYDYKCLVKQSEIVPLGLDSTFVAACLAHRSGANTIIMHGVDLSIGHSLYQNRSRIIETYRQLHYWLRLSGTELYCADQRNAISVHVPVYRWK